MSAVNQYLYRVGVLGLVTLFLSGCITDNAAADDVSRQSDQGMTLSDAVSGDTPENRDGSVSADGPRLAVEPAVVNFGAVADGETATADITLQSSGTTDLSINMLRVRGDAQFAVLIDGVALDAETPFTRQIIAPGMSLIVTVQYTAIAQGAQGELLIESNDPAGRTVAIVLRGESTTPCLQVSPTALEFPAALVGVPTTQTLTLESCGGPVRIERIELAEGSDPVFQVQAPDLPLTIRNDGDGQSPTISVSLQSPQLGVYNGFLVIYSDDSERPAHRVSLLGRVNEPTCPRALVANGEHQVEPGETVVLDGAPSMSAQNEGELRAYQWTVTQRPEGSTSAILESFNDPNNPTAGGEPDTPETPRAVFAPDVVGTYLIELNVVDESGLDSARCDQTAVVEIVARTNADLLVELVWTTPLDDDLDDGYGTDLDLHLLHPLADGWSERGRVELYDCFALNPAPDWGEIGVYEDDPALTIDDSDGAGPERIRLARAENTDQLRAPYLVGVDYYAARNRLTGEDFGPSYANLRVYIRGELSWQYIDEVPADPRGRRLDAGDAIWAAAQIEWPSGIVTLRQ